MRLAGFLGAIVAVLLCAATGWTAGRFDGPKRWYLAQLAACLVLLAVAAWGLFGGFHMSDKNQRLTGLAVIILSAIAFVGWAFGRLMHRRP